MNIEAQDYWTGEVGEELAAAAARHRAEVAARAWRRLSDHYLRWRAEVSYAGSLLQLHQQKLLPAKQYRSENEKKSNKKKEVR